MGALEILYEDNHLLVINKPAQLPTQGADAGEPSVWTWGCGYLKQKYQKPGNVYLGVVSRLDAVVSGVVVLARTSKAAARLSRQFQERTVSKVYWALVAGVPQKLESECRHWVYKDEGQHKMAVSAPGSMGAQEAVMRYRVVGHSGDERSLPLHSTKYGVGSWLEIQLLTGRKHQIRVQLAALGHPIWGDQKYGSSRPFVEGIALHSRTLSFEHPVRGETLQLEAPLPQSWPRIV